MVAVLFFLLTSPVSLPPQTVPGDRSSTLVRALDLQSVDVREALRDLFREHLFGYTIATDVQGTVTLSLRNVTFDVALQNILRQVDATYRVNHGFYEVVHRPDSPATPAEAWPAPETRRAIDERYASIRSAVKNGKGSALTQWLGDDFKVSTGSGDSKGLADALRMLVDLERNYPMVTREYAPYNAWERTKSTPRISVLISYRRGDGGVRRFFDRWEETQMGWRLMFREDAGMPTLKLVFHNADLSDVVHRLFSEMGISAEIDPAIQGKVSGDFTGMPFETILQKILANHNLTYRVVGGVYHIVPR